jgi:hypothetical protein
VILEDAYGNLIPGSNLLIYGSLLEAKGFTNSHKVYTTAITTTDAVAYIK